MKIREVRVQHFRNFGEGSPPIRFYDESTGLVRPLSVLVGSNGSGKSTVFQIIEGLFSYALDVVEDMSITHEIKAHGYAAANVEFDACAPPELGNLWIALGRKDRAPAGYRDLDNLIGRIEQRGASGKPWEPKGPRHILNQWVGGMMRGDTELRDGLLLFPHDRWIEHEQRGAIEPPPRTRPWLFHFDRESGWQGSLSQLWVWQNYLDLEQRREGRENLLPFVDPIERILGRGQKVVIQQGHVRIERQDGSSVEPHQLPSGEQQILALFGEIVRRLRPGAVILIDEIEISLHPALQRAVLYHLRQLAREHDLQIVISTHSMEIVESVAPSEIINMDDMVAKEQAKAPEVGS